MLAAHMDEIGLVVTKGRAGLPARRQGRAASIPARRWARRSPYTRPGPARQAYPDGLARLHRQPPTAPAVTTTNARRSIPLTTCASISDCRRPSLNGASSVWAIASSGAGPRPSCSTAGWRPRRWTTGPVWRSCWAHSATWPRMQHSWDVYAVATVQEEIGLRGATTAAFGVAPDLAVALDVTFGEHARRERRRDLPDGPRSDDRRGAEPPSRRGQAARSRPRTNWRSRTQVEPMHGPTGTDAWAIQVSQAGMPTGLLSVPVRYMHSSVETVATPTSTGPPACWPRSSPGWTATTLAGLVDDLS